MKILLKFSLILLFFILAQKTFAGYLNSPIQEYTVNSWFDHSTPQGENNDQYIHQMTRWDGKVFDDRISSSTQGISWYNGHEGIDLDATDNTPVYASLSGIVTNASSSFKGGIFVRIWNSANSVATYYGHLSTSTVRNGNSISKGQLIGFSGHSGPPNTGPHLHFGVYDSQNGWTDVIDPYGFTGTTTASGYEQGIYWTGTTTDRWASTTQGYLWATYPPTFQQYTRVDITNNISTTTTWTSDNLYVVHGAISINSGKTLNINKGVIVKFYDTNSGLDVYGSLKLEKDLASGTSTPPTGERIYFTSYKDDSLGGDTNGDGATTTPDRGDWNKISFKNGSFGDIYNAIFRYGGNSSSGVIETLNASTTINYGQIYMNSSIGIKQTSGVLTLSNSIINNNEQKGFYILGGTSTVISNTFGSSVYSDQDYGMYLLDNGTSTVYSNQFYNHQNTAVYTKSSYPNQIKISLFNNNFFNNSKTIGLSDNIFLQNSNNNSYGTGTNAIFLYGSIDQELDLFQDNIPYLIDSSYTVSSNASLQIHPGVVIKFSVPESYLDIYGNLNAQGATSSKVYLTSIKDNIGGNTDGSAATPNLGDWGTIQFHPGSTGILNNVIVGYGGYSISNPFIDSFCSQFSWVSWYYERYNSAICNRGGSLNIYNSEISSSTNRGIYQESGSLIFNRSTSTNNSGYGIHQIDSLGTTIVNSTLSNNYNYGYGFYQKSGSTTLDSNLFESNQYIGARVIGGSINFNNNSFNNNPSAPISLSPESLTFTHSNNSSTGSTNNGIVIYGTVDSVLTLDSSDLNFIITGVLNIPSGRSLILKPGTVLKLSGQTSYINIEGYLTATSTSQNEIYITSINDNIGQDNTSATTTPSPGDWASIKFKNGSTGEISNAIISYGGYNSLSTGDTLCSYVRPGYLLEPHSAGLCNMGGSLNISSTTISDISSAYGSELIHSSSGYINGTNLKLQNGNYGLYILGGIVDLSQSSIFGNGQGIYSVSSATTTAENNWWGDASGPYNTTYNPSGTGNPVNDYVDFNPWLNYDPNP